MHVAKYKNMKNKEFLKRNTSLATLISSKDFPTTVHKIFLSSSREKAFHLKSL